jgi:hypothetical protein
MKAGESAGNAGKTVSAQGDASGTIQPIRNPSPCVQRAVEMPDPGFNFAPSLQFASDMLFMAGSAGAVYMDFKMSRTLVHSQVPGRPFISRKELYGLVVICLIFTFLIAAAVLLPIIYGLNEPGGIQPHGGVRGGWWLVAAWALNSCGSVWLVLRLTRGQHSNRVRYGAASAIALACIVGSLESYFGMVKPSLLPRLIGPPLASGILAAVGAVCLFGVYKLTGDPRTGPLFDWRRLWIRAFGWIVIAANSVLLVGINVMALHITKRYLPGSLLFFWPSFPVLLMMGLYYLRRESLERSRKMTYVLLVLLAMEGVALWAILTYAPRH